MAITIPIVAEWNPKGIDRAAADIQRAEGKMGKVGAGFRTALVPATAALAGLAAAGYQFAQAAAADEKSAATLAGALKKVTGATDGQVASVEEWISAQGRALGVADDKLRPALATLVRATGDVGAAQASAALAMDISAATGKDLSSVSAALAKAHGGNTGALAKLVPGLDKAVLASGDMEKIQSELSRTMGGSAADAANTSAGRMERMQLAVDEAKESIGRGLLPALGTLADKLAGAATWVEENSDLVLKLGVALAAIAGTVVAVNAAMSAWAAIQAVVRVATIAWTAVQWALNAALLANPIALIVLAIIALVAIIVLAWKKSDTFRAIVTAAWEKVQDAIKVVVDWFKGTVWPILKRVIGFIVGYYKLLWSIVKIVWKGIWNAIKAVVDWFMGTAWPIIRRAVNLIVAYYQALFRAVKVVFDKVRDVIKVVVDWFMSTVVPKVQDFAARFTAVFDSVRSSVVGVWDGIQSAIRRVVDWIAEKIRWLADKIGSVPGLGGLVDGFAGSYSVDLVPQLARGASSPVLTSRASGATIIINGALDPDAVARQVDQLLSEHRGRAGRTGSTRARAW